ncbi:MAG: 50S ribosomal protein L4 [Candidatus Aenigmatarchaeota archaeon]
MKSNVFDVQGKVKGQVDLPKVFSTPVRPDLIKRAVQSVQSHNRQPNGTDPLAGKRTSAHYHSVRHYRYSMMNKEMARMQRIHEGPGGLQWTARFVPQSRKGRVSHPPKPNQDFSQKMNNKERVLAIKSAIAATAFNDIVSKRGHIISNMVLPIIVEDSVQEIKKSKQLKELLEKLGMVEELERSSKKKIRAGRGKMRGRKYKRRVGPLIVIGEDKGISMATKNIEGMECCLVKNLNAEMLAPGTYAGRLTIFTESSIKKLGEIYGK